MNMTGVFTGSLAIVFGLGFWLGLLAMVIGTVLGSLPVAYLSTWGPRTGTGQLPASRMAFGGTVVLPAIVQWLSSIAWDGLVGLFGGEALAALLHTPFWVGVLIGIAGAKALGAQTAEGVRSVMGGGFLGGLALVVIALASVGSNAMNDYSGSLALQTVGVRVRRPVSALVVTVIAFFLILWMHGGGTGVPVQNRFLF